MQVEYDLAAGRLVELLDRHALGAERRHRGRGYLLNGTHAGRELLRRRVKDVARWRLRNHQRMPLAARHDVHERQGVGVLVDLVARHLAAQDFSEDVCWIVAHLALEDRQSAIGPTLVAPTAALFNRAPPARAPAAAGPCGTGRPRRAHRARAPSARAPPPESARPRAGSRGPRSSGRSRPAPAYSLAPACGRPGRRPPRARACA